jgi:hypothetical protein
MSLKAFHVVFIAASIVLAVGFGLWALSIGGGTNLLVALTSFASAVALVAYEVGFLRKCRELGL